jgi:sulfate transport system ATP-binding protein
VFVRPHSLEIDHHGNGGGTFRATVTHINAAGPLVRVDLLTHWGVLVHVEISHGRYSALELKKEDEVFVRPKERRVFVRPPEQIDGSGI